MNPGGDAFVAFGNDRGVYVVRRPQGGAWSAPQPVANVGRVGGPVIAKGSRPAALLWTTFNTDPYRVQLAPVLSTGSFGPVETLPIPGYVETSRTLDDGTVAVLVQTQDDGLVAVERSPAGANSDPVALAAFGGQPHLAASGDQLVAAWSQNDSGGGRLYAADRRPDGTWDSPQLIGDPQRDIVAARSFLLADRAGNLTVVLNTTDVRRTDPIAPPVDPGESRAASPGPLWPATACR